MTQNDFLNIIPDQYTGREIEAEEFVELNDANHAIIFFNTAKDRLLNVNKWHHLAGSVSASFQAVDINGKEVERSVQKGDYMRIDIPGPGNKDGDGFDWVAIEELKEMSNGDVQSVGFRVRPVSNPLGNKESIAHFYDNAATSNFIITREGKKITASIIDVNIKPNDNTASLTDKIRDTAVGLGGMTIFSKIQWKSLAKGLVKI